MTKGATLRMPFGEAGVTPPSLAAHDFAILRRFGHLYALPAARRRRSIALASRIRRPPALANGACWSPPDNRTRWQRLLVVARQSHPLAEPADRAYRPHPLASPAAVCVYRPHPPSPAAVHACARLHRPSSPPAIRAHLTGCRPHPPSLAVVRTCRPRLPAQHRALR